MTQTLDVEIEIFSFGRSGVDVVGSSGSHDVYARSGK